MSHERAADDGYRGEEHGHVGRDDIALDAGDQLDGVVRGAHRAERNGPAVADERHRCGARRGEAEHNEERRRHGDRDSETGDALDKAGESPADEQCLRKPVVGQAGHRAPDGVDAFQLVDQVEHIDRRPHDSEDEHSKAEPFGAGDSDVVARGAEDDEGEGEREGPGRRSGPGGAPVDEDDRDDQQDYRRRGQQPVGQREVGACHERMARSVRASA